MPSGRLCQATVRERVNKKVRFDFTVSFWFPAHYQLCLSTASQAKAHLACARSPEGCIPGSSAVCPAMPGPPIFSLPRSKAKGKATPTFAPTAASSACSPFALTPSNATVVSEVVGEGVPVLEHPLLEGEHPNRFTSFDELHGTRVLVGSADWPAFRYVAMAVETSLLPGVPTGRIMLSELASFPSPQVAITQDRGPDLRRAIVVDAGLIGGEVETLDVFLGVTPVGVIRGLRSVLHPRVAEEQLASGQLLCLINRALVDHRVAIPGDADVMQFVGLRLPVPAHPAEADQLPARVEPKAATSIARYQGPRPQTPAIPVTAVRPPPPPIPRGGASQMLVDRYLPDFITTRPFTAFDAHYGHRTFYCHGFASYPERLQIVLQASPALGRSPRYRWLDKEVEGLPLPQLVLQAAHIPSEHWTFPLDLRSCGGHVCVLIANRLCSAVEFIARATDVCRLHGRMSTLLSEGAFVLDVDGHYVAPAADGILKFASIAKLRRSQPWGRSRVFRRHGATAHILPDRQSPTALEGAHGSGSSSADEQALSSPAYYPLDDDRFPAGEDLSVLVHTVGAPPHSILVPYAASADTVCQVATYALAAQLPASAPGRCRWRPCSVTPVGEHALHSVFVVGELEAQAESHVVLDLRAARVTGPDFHSMVFPSTLSVELLFRLLTTFLGGQRPVAIFHGITPVSGYFCTLASGDMLRPVSACVTSAQVHLSPAMWRTPDCMEAMPGLRVASMAARVPAARGNDPQVATTHTTSMAPALGSTTTTTVAARASVAHNDPWTGAQRLTLHVHIPAGPSFPVFRTGYYFHFVLRVPRTLILYTEIWSCSGDHI